MKPHWILLPLFAVLVFAGRATADIVHLKSGGRVEGLATPVGEEEVVVETLAGETKLKASAVDRIDIDHEAPIEVYRALEAAAAKKSEPGFYLDLAAWALEHRATRFVEPNVVTAVAFIAGEGGAKLALDLADRFEKRLGHHLQPLWQRLLQLDAGSERARRALGYRLHAGRWLTEEEFQASQGNVRFEGEWMTPARRDLIEKQRASGFAKREQALLEAERLLTRREKAVAVDKSEVRTAKRELESRASEIAHERERLSDWEADLLVRERILRGLRVCRSCGTYYSRTHICPNQWTHCARCGGYFPKNHRCPR
jgi:ribosomal protein L32